MWTLSAFADEIDDDLEVQCQTLQRLGIGCIELRSAWGVNVSDFDDAMIDDTRAILDKYGITVSSIGSPIGKIGVTEPFDPHLERFENVLTVAADLKAAYVRVFSFFIPDGDDPDGHRDEVLRRMAALAELAERHQTVLLHENEKHIYGDIPRRCLDLVETIGSRSLRLTWDSANFVQCGVRPFTDAYALLRPHVEYVQVKDAQLATGEVVPAGLGDGELVETWRALRDDGFDGYFSLEPHLRSASALGGFSGPELFEKAHAAFTGQLRLEGIDFG
ncbi:MAG: sugar phosphate isomerase/epimerase family protein [Nocardioidaceae bacterium]